MKKRNNNSGQGLVVLIILLAIIGCGVWWLFNTKKNSDRAARAFGREMINRLAINHDPAFFANNLGPQAKLDYPPSQQGYIMAKFTELGVPAQPISIEESVVFESHFFEPKGYFTGHLNYPGRSASLQIAISHPVSKWQLDNLTMTFDQAR
jgi:hypothetical protein